MERRYPVYTESADCQDCYKCIRRCPVKAIKVEGGHAQVVPDMCIACGRCVVNCPSFAKRARNDTAVVKRLLGLKPAGKVFVSLAPSAFAEFSEFSPGQLEAALLSLGFFAVSETALGADLVSAHIASELQRASDAVKVPGTQKLFISSACPVVVEYIKRYEKDFAPYITDCASPLLAHARLLRSLYGAANDGIGVVFIGPCIAKKNEADQWEEIDAAITFQELRDWFKEENISPDKFPAAGVPEFVPRRAAGGTLYPTDGGMIASWKHYHDPPEVISMAVSGAYAIKQTLKEVSIENLRTLQRPLFLELLFCSGGCVNGPGASQNAAGMLRRMRLLEYAESADTTLDSRTLENRFPLGSTLTVSEPEQSGHSEEEIRAALRQVGKFSSRDELNCSSCGYESCRDFAIACLEQHAEKTMCVSYMRNLAQKKANGLIRAIPSGVVIADKDGKIVECNRNFAHLMGKDLEELFEVAPGLEGADLGKILQAAHYFTDVLAGSAAGTDSIECDIREGKKILHLNVFVVEKGEIAAGVMDDITAPRIRRDKTVSHAQKVIDRNLAAVQKIAFLLGENAAETEAILHSIIEAHSPEEGE